MGLSHVALAQHVHALLVVPDGSTTDVGSRHAKVRLRALASFLAFLVFMYARLCILL